MKQFVLPLRHTQFALLLLLALLAACESEAPKTGVNAKAGKVAQPVQEASFVLKKQDLSLLEVKNKARNMMLPITGRVVPKNITVLFSEVQGRVRNAGFRFEAGNTFSAGETLIALDATEFSLELEARRSAFLNILTGMMPDLKADYPDNFVAWRNYVQSYQSGAALAPLPPTRSDGEKYYVTSNQVYTEYYSIKALEERLSKFKLVAPYAGIITQANTDKGSLVSPGQNLGTIINNRAFELEAAISLELAAQMQVGDQVQFNSNNVTGSWTGTLSRINDIVDASTQNIPVFFTISGPGLRAGMYLEGNYSGRSYTRVFTAPSGVLTRDDKVLLLQGNTITGKAVELVATLGDSVIISGLADQDLLIANQFDVPVEGMKLTL